MQTTGKGTVIMIQENTLYMDDVIYVSTLDLPWEKLNNGSLLVSGATGLLGSFLVDVIMAKNTQGLNCNVYAIGRNKERAAKRFEKYWGKPLFKFIQHDITEPLEDFEGKIDFVLHLASNTHPLQYSQEPVSTITTNILGTCNMLEFAYSHQAVRSVFASSVEIYGESRGDVEKFNEKYCGYIDSNTLRAGYPESKRCGEALCQAYIREKNLDIVIPRLSRCYGPTMLMSDSKALSQFLKNGLNGENIILKSTGTQYYSYSYVADAVSGILTAMLKGECGHAYNISDDNSDIRLKDLATTISRICGTEVVFEIPDDNEAKGYSKATVALLDSTELRKLGWMAHYSIEDGLERTINILKATK